MAKKELSKELSFEEAMKKLEECAGRLSAEDINLDEAIRCYEEGIAFYNTCGAILDAARQKVEVIGETALKGENHA
jgi:exodeoxyribonuclease VII small subunit